MAEISAVFAHREVFSIQPDGILCCGNWLVILPPIRKAVIDELHKEKMKSLARKMGCDQKWMRTSTKRPRIVRQICMKLILSQINEIHGQKAKLFGNLFMQNSLSHS